MDFSGPDSPRRRFFREALAAYGLAWLWVSAVGMLITLAVVGAHVSTSLHLTPAIASAMPQVRQILGDSPFGMLFLLLVFAPLFEEAVFRVLPLTFALVMGSYLNGLSNRYARDFVHVTSIVVCGLLFGILHGGPINVFIQGFVGLVLGRLYLRNAASPWRAYLICALVHSLYNFTTVAVQF